ncbi:MAG TPA: response regulator [Candidatus Acidoferrales bacterium]|nr:response regulator [Candidatus Acidoferrales bacterium]
MSEVGILIIDDDVSTQRALKSILDSEGWRVRIVSSVGLALAELASGKWNLAIANTAVADVHGPLFAILKELAQAEYAFAGDEAASAGAAGGPGASAAAEGDKARIRALFLVPVLAAKDVQPMLEREGLAYTLKPYHLHDFLERVSELLVESGAIFEPIRTMADLSGAQRRLRAQRTARDSRRGAMFASREDYQMTEEEMADWERQEEEDRKKREKDVKAREHPG